MERRKSVYGHDEWAKHQSSWRHGRHILSTVSSGVIFRTGPPVVLCTLVAVFVSVFNHLVLAGRLPDSVPKLEVSSIPFTLTSSVLSLLLVFRTNSSYNRFDEARKAWGSNVNRTRDLARQALTNIRSPEDTPQLHCLLRHIKAYSFCLKSHLTAEPIRPRPEGAATHQVA
jgi:putative membrane protein